MSAPSRTESRSPSPSFEPSRERERRRHRIRDVRRAELPQTMARDRSPLRETRRSFSDDRPRSEHRPHSSQRTTQRVFSFRERERERYKEREAEHRGAYFPQERHFGSRSYETGAAPLSQTTSYSASFVDRLRSTVRDMMRKHPENYSGWKHAVWARHLSTETEQDSISHEDIELYAVELAECIPTIKNWSIDAAMHFYSMLEHTGFFSNMGGVSAECRNIVWDLHHTLISKLASQQNRNKFIVTQNNISSYMGLVRVISKMMSNILLIQNKDMVQRLLLKTIDALKISTERFTPFIYKEIVYYSISMFLDNNETAILPLMEKYMSELSDMQPTMEDNETFFKALVCFTRIFKHVSLSSKSKENLNKLTHKTRLYKSITEPADLASGFYVISRNLKVLSAENVRSKFNECCKLFDAQKDSFSIETSCSLAHSLSTLAIFNDEVRDEAIAMLGHCLTNISHEKGSIPSNRVISLFLTVDNLRNLGIYQKEFFDIAIQAIRQNQSSIFNYPFRELHQFIFSFASLLKACRVNSNALALSLEPFIQGLIEKYQHDIKGANFKTRLDGFCTLSELSKRAFLPGRTARVLITELFSSLNQDKHHLERTSGQRLDFLYSVASLGTFCQVNIEEYAELFYQCAKKFSLERESTTRKLSLLWSIIAFWASHKSALEQNYPERVRRLNKAAVKLYCTINEPVINESSKSIMQMAESWLGLEIKHNTDYTSRPSVTQIEISTLLQREFGSREVVLTEQGYLDLPPCDIAIPARNIFIEVQGPQHYIDPEKRFKTGKTAIKLEQYRKAGIEILEIQTGSRAEMEQSVQECIDKIKKMLQKPRF